MHVSGQRLEPLQHWPAGPTKAGASEDLGLCSLLAAAWGAQQLSQQGLQTGSPGTGPQGAHPRHLRPGIQWPSTCACSQVPTRHTVLPTDVLLSLPAAQQACPLTAVGTEQGLSTGMDEWMGGWMDEWVDGWVDEWLDDGLMDRQMDGWMNG